MRRTPYKLYTATLNNDHTEYQEDNTEM